jgi:2-hydroxymuconate-semialdehyde hydrolase
MAAAIEELRVQTAGYATTALRSGSGLGDRPLLALHGGGPGATAEANWTSALSELGEGIEMLAPDLLGFGTTDHPGEGAPEGMVAWQALRVEQILALLDALGHDWVDIVGNSMGGSLALRLAVEHPERVGRLVLMGSAGAPFAPGPGLAPLLGFYDDPTPQRLRSVLDSFVYDLDSFGDVDELVASRIEAALRPEVRRSWAAMYAGPPAPEALRVDPEALAQLPHPVLLLHGRDDRIVPPEASLWLLERLPEADLTLLGRCGHWIMLERPQAFRRAVLEFIARPTKEVVH